MDNRVLYITKDGLKRWISPAHYRLITKGKGS